MPWAPFSMAPRARAASKWMSAITGSGERGDDALEGGQGRSLSGTATRTMSQPALFSRRICFRVPSTSSAAVLVIDWMETRMDAADPHPADKDFPLHG